MTTPDPTIWINGAPSPADVGAGATVSGSLNNPAGAEYWSVAVTAADDLTSVAAVQATLVVNQTNKTFSFTAPGTQGTCVQLTSIVGINGLGLDANGRVNPAFTGTYKVNVPAANGLRVLFGNESAEQNATVGWVAAVNAAIRNAGGSGGSSSPPIRMSVGTEATTTSGASVTGGQLVSRVTFSVGTGYSPGTTVEVGYAGALGAIVPSGVIDPTVSTDQPSTVEIDFVMPSTQKVVVTLSGPPSVGAMEVTTYYASTTS
jgi:hypothetical protein